MSETPEPISASDEDERRRDAAERNRKAALDQWEANKRRWLTGNFPEKSPEPESSDGSAAG